LDTPDPTLARLDDQLNWYDGKSAFSKRWYIRLRLASLVSAAAVPITSTFGHSAVTSVLGALIVIVGQLRSRFLGRFYIQTGIR
jgi:hypothetical protein